MAEGPPSHSPLSLGATFYSGSGVGRHKIRDSRTWAILTICRKIGSSRYLVSARALKIALMKPFWDTKQRATNGMSTGGGRALIQQLSPATPATLAASDADCGFQLRLFCFFLFFEEQLIQPCARGYKVPQANLSAGNETFVTDWITSSKPNSAVQMLHK